MEGYTVKGLSVVNEPPVGSGRPPDPRTEPDAPVGFRQNERRCRRALCPGRRNINHLTVNLLLERIDNYGDKFAPAAIHRNNTEWETIRELRARYINKEKPILLKDI